MLTVVVAAKSLFFLKSIAAVILSIGSSLTMHFLLALMLLLLRVSLAHVLELLSPKVLSMVTGVTAAFIDKSIAKLQRTFLILSHSYEGKLARYFLSTLCEVPGITTIPGNTASYNPASSYKKHRYSL